MKTTRMLALLLALLLAFSLASFPALAAEGDVINGEVDIKNNSEVSVDGNRVWFKDTGSGNQVPYDPGADLNYNPLPITITAATADSPSTVVIDASVNAGSSAGIDVINYAGGELDVEVSGSVTGASDGVEAEIKTYYDNDVADTTITVKGDVTATESEGSAVNVASKGKNANVEVIIEGSAEGSTGVSAYSGYLPESGNGGNTSVTVKENVTANEVGVNARANINGNTSVDVGGNVTATGGVGIVASENSGKGTSVTVGGSVDADTGIRTESDSSSVTIIIGKHTEDGEADISTELDEETHNVEAKQTGIEIKTSDKDNAKTNVTIDGVLSVEQGGTPIVLGDSVSETNAGNVNITVWKIEGQTGDMIVTGGGEGAAQAVQENINYIIKIAPDETSRTVFSGYKGGETLNQGEQPIAVNVPDGFTLKAAYATDGTAVPITKGADGKYYAVIPAGGGIYLSATLDKAAAASSGAAIEVDYYGYGGVTAKTMAAKQPAVKKQGPVTITFDPAGGRWGDSGESVVMKGPCTVEYTLPEAPNREGFRFVRWQCDDEDVAVGAPGERFTPGFGGSFRFTAVWEKV